MKEIKENIEEIMIEGATCDACVNCGKVHSICNCYLSDVEPEIEKEN